MKIKLIFFTTLFVLPAVLFAANISISQIDSSPLLLSQEVNLYVSITDDAGKPVKGLTADKFEILESVDNQNFTPMTGTGFKSDANKLQGIHFLLLIDNSGSMYDTLAGRATEDPEARRITHAKRAILSFLESVKNANDTIGLAYFNTNYHHLVEQTKDLGVLRNAMDSIEKPEDTEVYTELYASLTLATDHISSPGGRKAIIVLSDGENYSYFDKKKRAHPVFGEKIYRYDEPVRMYQEEGISCYAVNFGGAGDEKLVEISYRTGGTVFNAANSGQLESVYKRIQERILNEYMITYRAGMEPGDRKYVKAVFTEGSGKKDVTRFYFSSTLFGTPVSPLSLMMLVPIVLAALLWFLLTRIRFIKLNQQPSLEVLDAGPGTVVTRMVPLTKGQTIIGGSDNANLTIAGVTSIKDNHATIIFDKKEEAYTIVSDQEISVNNNFVKKKKLEAGDVINVEGATIVFDDETFVNDE